MFKRVVSCFVAVCFACSLIMVPQAKAGEYHLNLPMPGTMVNLSPAYEPALIKGLTVHRDNPFLFDFILDTGNDLKAAKDASYAKSEADRLIKYFFACLTIPEKDLWVNLSPYEKDHMVPQALGQTALGRDLLTQDYMLKQLTASLIYPEKDLGKEFWNRIYAKAQELYGTTQIPVNTFNKVWILADKASVYENGQTAFVLDGHLKVMLEEDYLSLKNHVATQRNSTHTLASKIVRELVLPEIEKEVNTGKNFASLRQIFNSLILATWYKKDLKEALLNQVYTDKSTVKGVNLNDPSVKEQIYQQYLKAYKKGVFNYIKEDAAADGQMIPRKYFSGGFDVALTSHLEVDTFKTPGIGTRILRTASHFMNILLVTTALTIGSSNTPAISNAAVPSANALSDTAMDAATVLQDEDAHIMTAVSANAILRLSLLATEKRDGSEQILLHKVLSSFMSLNTASPLTEMQKADAKEKDFLGGRSLESYIREAVTKGEPTAQEVYHVLMFSRTPLANDNDWAMKSDWKATKNIGTIESTARSVQKLLEMTEDDYHMLFLYLLGNMNPFLIDRHMTMEKEDRTSGLVNWHDPLIGQKIADATWLAAKYDLDEETIKFLLQFPFKIRQVPAVTFKHPNGKNLKRGDIDSMAHDASLLWQRRELMIFHAPDQMPKGINVEMYKTASADRFDRLATYLADLAMHSSATAITTPADAFSYRDRLRNQITAAYYPDKKVSDILPEQYAQKDALDRVSTPRVIPMGNEDEFTQVVGVTVIETKSTMGNIRLVQVYPGDGVFKRKQKEFNDGAMTAKEIESALNDYLKNLEQEAVGSPEKRQLLNKVYRVLFYIVLDEDRKILDSADEPKIKKEFFNIFLLKKISSGDFDRVLANLEKDDSWKNIALDIKGAIQKKSLPVNDVFAKFVTWSPSGTELKDQESTIVPLVASKDEHASLQILSGENVEGSLEITFVPDDKGSLKPEISYDLHGITNVGEQLKPGERTPFPKENPTLMATYNQEQGLVITNVSGKNFSVSMEDLAMTGTKYPKGDSVPVDAVRYKNQQSKRYPMSLKWGSSEHFVTVFISKIRNSPTWFMTVFYAYNGKNNRFYHFERRISLGTKWSDEQMERVVKNAQKSINVRIFKALPPPRQLAVVASALKVSLLDDKAMKSSVRMNPKIFELIKTGVSKGILAGQKMTKADLLRMGMIGSLKSDDVTYHFWGEVFGSQQGQTQINMVEHIIIVQNGEVSLIPKEDVKLTAYSRLHVFYLERAKTSLAVIYQEQVKQEAHPAILGLPQAVKEGVLDDKALISGPGGIDLTNANSGMTVTKDAQGGVKVGFDAALIARIRRDGVRSAVPVIINVTAMSMAQIRPLFGFGLNLQ